MSNKTPIFPISDPQHFNDYGFDPQIDYFQVLKEAKRHKQEETSSKLDGIDSKLQKRSPESDSISTAKDKKRWWKNALSFFKGKRHRDNKSNSGVHRGAAAAAAVVGGGSMSGPVYYISESRSGSSTPYRNSSPIAGSLSPAQKDDVMIPYVSLREVNVDQQHSRMSTSAMPIYLVT